MKMRKHRTDLKYLATSVLAFIIGLSAQAQSGFVVDKIISKVDNYIVLKSELENTYQSYLAQGTQVNKCQILGSLLLNKMMMAKAEIDSVIVTDLEVDQNTDQRMSVILQQSGNSPERLEQAYGKTMDQIKLELRDQVREQVVGRAMQMEITQDILVTPNEVRKFYNKIPKDSLPYYARDVEVAQIVKVAEVSEVQKEEARQRLMQIRERILNGENFNTLARQYSEDPSAPQNGGEMGYVGRGRMVPAFEAMAFKMKNGEISMPFESQYGFHMMQLIDRRGNEYNSRHILISATPSEDDIKVAERYLDSLRTQIMNDSISFVQAAKLYSDDDFTKGQGGFFSDAEGGTRISLDDIDPVVYFAIDNRKVGDISQPLRYRTDDQREAVRILYFKSELPPHEANLKDDWHRIQAAALAEKKDRTLDKWFEQAQKDVFISIDSEYNYCNIIE